MLRASRQKKTRHVAVPGKSEGASTPSCIALKGPSSSAAATGKKMERMP